MELPPQISNEQLKPADMPGEDASWAAIRDFAHSFNAYEVLGSFEKCAETANEQRHETLTDLRTCLFFEVRRANHMNWVPEPGELDGFHALIADIRAKVSR